MKVTDCFFTYDLQQLQKVDPVAVYNEVKSFPQIGALLNNWRMRWVSVHEHPTQPDRVFTIGFPFENPCAEGAILTVEAKHDWRQCINKYPKVLIYD